MLQLIPADQPQFEEQRRLNKLARRWHSRIRREKTAHKKFRKQAKDAWDIFRNQDESREVPYPLLWSVTSIQHAATYSSRPVPVVKPRNSSRNPANKLASDIVERGLEFACDQTEFDDTIHRVVDDYLVAGLGVPRVKLDSEIEEIPVLDEMGQTVIDEEGEAVTESVITDQNVRAEFVPWSRFGWEPATCWEHVSWVYFKHPMSKGEITKRYGKDASFGASEDEYSSESSKVEKDQVTYWVYEIWDKENREVIHLAEGGQEPLEIVEDPLRLVGFFPNPPPILTNSDYDRVIPKPDYEMIAQFAEDLNELKKRERALVSRIKDFKFYDASIAEMEDPEFVEDGTWIAIKNIKERMEGGTLESLVMSLPIDQAIKALQVVREHIVSTRAQVDEILGISDILRGASNPQEGQETQKIKERWSGIRLRRKQIAVQHLIRNVFRIMGEIMVEHFTRENLSRMVQLDITDETWQVLQTDVLREFAIDIESDSTVAKDEFQDKRERSELMTAMTNFIGQVMPAVNGNQIPGDMAQEMLRIVVQPYAKQARGLDQVIDNLPQTQKQLQQIQGLQGQIEQLSQQLQQRDYALSQYSQAEENRKNQETQGKVMRDMASAQETLAGIPTENAEIAADIELTRARVQEIYNKMAKPCGCD